MRDVFGRYQPLRFWDADSGAGAGGTDEGAGDGDDSDDADAGGDTGGNGDEPFAVFKDKRAFSRRLDRETRTRLEAEAKELGFASSEEMRAALKGIGEAKAKEKSELEREREHRSKAEADRDAATARANRMIVRATALTEAGKLGVRADRIDRLIALTTVGLSEIDIDEDGNADVDAIKKALEAELKDLPEWKADAAASKSGAEFGAGGANGGAKVGMTELIRQAAGRSP